MESRFPSLAGKVEVIHNGIDLRPFERPRPGFWDEVPAVAGAKPLLGVVGYFYKNQEELIDLLPQIREVLPAAKLVIIGKDDAKQKFLEQRARECGVTDAVHFAGKIPHERIGDALAGLDFNVSAFRREGCALNVIESLAVGTPFVGYRAGSYPELVVDGVTGGLAETGEDFVRIVASLAGDPERLRQMRGKAREDAFERFAGERMIERYELLCRELTRAGR
jgi:glycosyltransferase involved in cell wall biosynthesis